MSARFWQGALIACCVFGDSQFSASSDGLFESKRITTPGEYARIEGPAVDRSGNLYAVNFSRLGTIGRLAQGAANSTLFATLPAGSIGNGIRIDAADTIYVADYSRHNIFTIKSGQTVPKPYFHSDRFNQPNDLAITKDGTLYASDPLFRRGTGRIWRIAPAADGTGRGVIMTSARSMGTTNGIDLGPDGVTLYVSESNTREVWAYRIDGDQLLDARLVRRFPDGELDGLRTDVDGRIYVARPAAGKIALILPDGTLVREIPLTASNPTNLAFGGPDQRTVYVTQGGVTTSKPSRSTDLDANLAQRPRRRPVSSFSFPSRLGVGLPFYDLWSRPR